MIPEASFPSGAFRVFAAVGTQLPFPRLLSALDAWAAARTDAAVLAQVGRDEGRYPNMRAFPFIDQQRFAALVAEADVVVAHAGMGTILSCSEIAKPLIIMPRRAALGEHRNDHQVDTAQRMCHLSNVTMADDAGELARALDALAQNAGSDAGAATGLSQTSLDLLHAVKAFIWGEDSGFAPAGPASLAGTR